MVGVFNLSKKSLHERLPLSRYLNQTINSVQIWSKQYETKKKDKIFIDSITITLSQCSDGCRSVKSNK
jgi:hypothetical protein